MRRLFMITALAMFMIGGLSVARADSHSPTDASNPALHPIVGSWIVTDESGLWPSSTVLMTFHGDGTAILIDQNGTTALGAWQSIGDRSAEFNMLFLSTDPALDELTRFLGTVEVLEDGDTFIRSSAIIGGDEVRGERILPGGATGTGHPEINASPSAGN